MRAAGDACWSRALCDPWLVLSATLRAADSSGCPRQVELADEVELKRAAAARGLLMLGPDCGTAMLGVLRIY